VCTGAVATVQSKSGGFVELTANADLSGATCTCAGSAASVKLTANVDICGAGVTSTASGTNAITGATVTLNWRRAMHGLRSASVSQGGRGSVSSAS
jgi:hypothetical protein